jgi:succinate-semialdehyde dehydrogenase/glutarate-semialdehyde dehydrogenase
MKAFSETQIAGSLRRGLLLMDGAWIEGAQSRVVLDKFQRTPWGEVAIPSPAQVAQCVAAAERAFRASSLDAHARGAILDRAAAIVESRLDEFTDIMCAEAGFTRHDAAGEVKRCGNTLRLSAEEARRFTGEMVPIEGAGGQTGRIGFTLRVPLGVVCAITPFNSPLNTVAHKVGPALAAGNAVVLKPSSNTPFTAIRMAEALLEAGLPRGLLSIVHGGADVAGSLLDEPRIRFYAFTGSTEVGREIQARAGLRRTQMELGSIAYCIICDDADLDSALPKVVNAAYRKAGQVCTSIQMLLVQRSRFAEVEARLSEMVAALPYGDPSKPTTVCGPVINEGSAERIASWIDEAMHSGARRLAGGERSGSVIPPTLLVDVPETTPLGCQEVFGPVMCLASFDTLDEAIARVNATPYGLATGVFTNRLRDAFAAARKLEVGGVHINETSSSRVDVMPYGGSKDSGFGREGPHYAVREMSEERMITLLP